MYRKSAISHKQFRLTIAKQLVGGYSMRSHRARQKEITELDRTLAQHHTRSVFPDRPRACRLCSKHKLKTRAGRAKEQEMVVLSARSISIKTVSGSTMRMYAALQQRTNSVSMVQPKPKAATQKYLFPHHSQDSLSYALMLSTVWQEAIVSATLITATVSSLCSAWSVETLGRRLTVLLSGAFVAVAGVITGFAPTKEMLLLGRLVSGLAFGLASVAGPIYVAETSPTSLRGWLVSINQVMICLGILVSSLMAGALSHIGGPQWRYMVGVSAFPGALQVIGLLFMPESPRWLASKGRLEEARAVLGRLRKAGDDLEAEMKDIIMATKRGNDQAKGGLQNLVMVTRTPHIRKALVLGSGLLFFQQFCGIDTVVFYSGFLFKVAGFPVSTAVWLVSVPNLINFLFSFLGLAAVERMGRRPVLMLSSALAALGLAMLAGGFQLISQTHAELNSSIIERNWTGQIVTECATKYTSCQACVEDNSCGFCYTDVSDGSCLPSAGETHSLVGRCNESSSTELEFKWTEDYCPSRQAWVALLGMAVFVAAFGPGLGPMPWTINSEIYPYWVRGVCSSITLCVAWGATIVVAFTFLTLAETIAIPGTFWMFCGTTLLGLVFTAVLLPETRGLSLEQVEQLFKTPGQRQGEGHSVTVIDIKQTNQPPPAKSLAA
ncbi:proton myo-inositol cotransporter [Plakobranchus ocellatus]|uniref:Proton myo-inositol cotransporter n=1 Tax=Plakobranchus ocellatus TaxID=259542 RepID=A0AAV4AQD6_9GAST|nr:proton myo-inositol cotransporter [Plakobranchus ocellatus]